MIGDEPRNGGNRMVKRDRENGEEREEKIEKPNLSVGDWATVRLDPAMVPGCDFLAHRVADCEGATSERRLRRHAIHFPIWPRG